MVAFLDHDHIWILLSLIHNYFAIVDCTVNCAHEQRFLEVFLSQCNDLQCRIMPVSNAVSSEGLTITGIQFYIEEHFFEKA